MATYAEEITEALILALKYNADFVKNPKEGGIDNIFYTMPHWSGVGSIRCGREAHTKLRNVVYKALSKSKYYGLIEEDAVFRKALELFSQRFIGQKAEPTSTTAKLALDDVISYVAASIKSITHYFPLHFRYSKGIESFDIGDVSFASRSSMKKEIEDIFDKYLSLESSSGADNSLTEREGLSDTALDYYKSFDWIIKINIPNCDPATSQKRAKKIASDALNCLNVLLGSKDSRHMRIAGPKFSNAPRAKFCIDEKMEPNVIISFNFLGHDLGEDWWDQLNGSGGDKLIEHVCIALSTVRSGQKIPQVAQRFLDSASWFGEAVRDDFSASKVVKYTAAIERLFVTKKTKNATENLVKRAAAFFYSRERGDIAEHESVFRSLYNLRSHIMHGKRSPFDPEIERKVYAYDRYVRICVQQFIFIAGKEAISASTVTHAQFEKWLNNIVNTADLIQKENNS